jgi:chromosome segregation ATPase
MPEPIKEGAVSEQPTPAAEPAKEQSIEELRAELESYKKKTELSANEISTRDKKLTELQKEVKARMSEEERIKAESQSVLTELLEEFSNIASGSIGLDDKHKALIKGSTKDEIKASAELVKSFKESLVKDYEKQIKTLTEELAIYKANGTPPKAGTQTEPANLQSAYNEAIKTGNAALQIAIKRQAGREGFVLTE